jgi:L-histidine Nalpha-methyltransferase
VRGAAAAGAGTRRDVGMLKDVAAGLALQPPKLAPKYFYDDAGARLFERITQLDAYYPTRTELGILDAHVAEMAELAGPEALVVEFGSGSGRKTRMLLRALERPAAYVPVDVAQEQLQQVATALRAEFPALHVHPVSADYTEEWPLPALPVRHRRTLAFFPGSTIGNFEPLQALRFLRRVRRLVGPAGGLLVGTDMHKDTAVLEQAYNDPEGVTAAFNLNMLVRLNRDCGTDFDVDAFRHQAIYDVARRRIEMRLVCERDVVITVPSPDGRTAAQRIALRAGEFIITEYSHKFTATGFRTLAAEAGWSVERAWSDDAGAFRIWLLQPSLDGVGGQPLQRQAAATGSPSASSRA